MYVLGGHDCAHSRAEARVYDPAANSWSYISNLPWANYDYSAAIIKQKNDERWLVIQARYQHHLHYLHIHILTMILGTIIRSATGTWTLTTAGTTLQTQVTSEPQKWNTFLKPELFRQQP